MNNINNIKMNINEKALKNLEKIKFKIKLAN